MASPPSIVRSTVSANSDEAKLRRTMVDVCRRMYERGLVGGSEGNVTVRLGPDRLLATPSRLCKGDLVPEDCVIIDLEGNPLEDGIPSSEIRMHLRIYKCRPDCQSVVHAHPI